MKKPAMFLDRDGTIFVDTGYPGDNADIRFIPGVVDALQKLQKHFQLIIISNQSGVGRGYITRDECKRVHQKMMAKLREQGISITDSFYCLHTPDDGCDCRKPKPGMLLEAAERWDTDLPSSFMAGDKMSDAEAGWRAGCRSVLLADEPLSSAENNTAAFPDIIVPDLRSAVTWILKRQGCR